MSSSISLPVRVRTLEYMSACGEVRMRCVALGVWGGMYLIFMVSVLWAVAVVGWGRAFREAWRI